MNKEIAIRDITILVLGFLTILLLFKGCNDRKRSTSLVLDLQNYSDKVKEYEDANGNLIEYNAAMQLKFESKGTLANLRTGSKHFTATVTIAFKCSNVGSLLIPFARAVGLFVASS